MTQFNTLQTKEDEPNPRQNQIHIEMIIIPLMIQPTNKAKQIRAKASRTMLDTFLDIGKEIKLICDKIKPNPTLTKANPALAKTKYSLPNSA